jgi:hypothetical protein
MSASSAARLSPEARKAQGKTVTVWTIGDALWESKRPAGEGLEALLEHRPSFIDEGFAESA